MLKPLSTRKAYLIFSSLTFTGQLVCAEPLPPYKSQAPTQSQSKIKLEFIQDCLIPTGTRLDQNEIGGLSALSYDESKSQLIALTDSQRFADPHLFIFNLPTNEKDLCPTPVSTMTFKESPNEEGLHLDGEGLSIDVDGTFYIASETSHANFGKSSSLTHFSKEGIKLNDLEVPQTYKRHTFLIPQGSEPAKPVFPDFIPPSFAPPKAPKSVKGTFSWGFGWLEPIVDYFKQRAWRSDVEKAKKNHQERVARLKEKHDELVRSLQVTYQQQYKMWMDQHLRKEAGLVSNEEFESLSFDRKQRILTTITEQPLYQDRGTSVKINRLLRMKLDKDGKVLSTAEYFYSPDEKMRVSELLDLGEGRLLTLEIHYSSSQRKVFSKIFEIQIEEAKGKVSEVFLSQTPSILEKKLVLDLNTIEKRLKPFYPKLDNLEGMTLGPKLASGQSSLILVSDNNQRFDQITQFIIFKILSK